MRRDKLGGAEIAHAKNVRRSLVEGRPYRRRREVVQHEDAAHGEKVDHGLRVVAFAATITEEEVERAITGELAPVARQHLYSGIGGQDASGSCGPVRVNLGFSAGDSFSAEPYAYVGPWDDRRPGDPAYWNAPFGAYVPRSKAGDADACAAFVRAGLARLAEE